jgi:hypothetical protein
VAQEVASFVYCYDSIDYASWTMDRLYKELVCEVHELVEGKVISSRGCFVFTADGYYW